MISFVLNPFSNEYVSSSLKKETRSARYVFEKSLIASASEAPVIKMGVSSLSADSLRRLANSFALPFCPSLTTPTIIRDGLRLS